MKRTDLIFEAAQINAGIKENSVHRGELCGTRYIETEITTRTEGISPGRYVTLFTGTGNVRDCLTELLMTFIPSGSVLVAGLGNEHIAADSFGVKALEYIPATAHLSVRSEFSELGMRSVYVIETGVTGKTGIESSLRIACLARYLGVNAVIVADSLACADIERLCTTIQITDTGISPGSGVGNDRRALNTETVGVPVIAIGVPTVIDLDGLTDSDKHSGLMVTPRNIDILSERMAEDIGIAISRAMNPALTESELRSLILM